MQTEQVLPYSSEYFKLKIDEQKFSAVVDLFKFKGLVKDSDRVLDFGCGGGYILHALPGATKIGVETRAAAADEARAQGLQIVGALEDVEDGWADVVISHHSLEHVDSPVDKLRHLRAKLRRGGQIIVVTPFEAVTTPYKDVDLNFHLYTWSPSNMGNLLKRAGFSDVVAEPLYHRFPPGWRTMLKVLGPSKLLDWTCRFYGRARTNLCQVKAVARNP